MNEACESLKFEKENESKSISSMSMILEVNEVRFPRLQASSNLIPTCRGCNDPNPFHTEDRCWVLHQEQRSKISLNRIKKKTNIVTEIRLG
jgi:hypothetical protein